MIDKFTKENITVDSFKDFVLELERNNLKNCNNDDLPKPESPQIRVILPSALKDKELVP